MGVDPGAQTGKNQERLTAALKDALDLLLDHDGRIPGSTAVSSHLENGVVLLSFQVAGALERRHLVRIDEENLDVSLTIYGRQIAEDVRERRDRRRKPSH